MNPTLELCVLFLSLCYAQTLMPNTWFCSFVAFTLSVAYALAPHSGDMVYLGASPDAMVWASGWVSFYIAYLFVDTCYEMSRHNAIIVFHHIVALIGFSANAESVWGTTTLFNVFLIELSGMMANLRQIMRSDFPKAYTGWPGAAFDGVFGLVYITSRAFVFPYRMYRCFTELRLALPADQLGTDLEFYLACVSLVSSLALNVYWSFLILKKMAGKLGTGQKIN